MAQMISVESRCDESMPFAPSSVLVPSDARSP